MVVTDVPNVCVIQDRHKGILQAIDDMQSGNVERQRTAQWPDIFYLHSAHTGYGCLG